METRIYGIRHHGPGSAKRLRRALQDWRPDCILLELPQDAGPALPYVGHERLRPPVALLVYNPRNLDQAAYLPFAEFSPEWQALRHGAREEVPVRPIDLPMSMAFSLPDTYPARQLALPAPEDDEAFRIQADPLGFLAGIAGYSDSERWWEATFEQEEADIDLFGAILDMVRELRSGLNRRETEETLLREAYMRKAIRQAQQEGFRRIAVVCGAWHAPALADVDRIRAAADNQRLRGLKKTKTDVTWIPWSYDRMARQSGYAAGVTSPAWYELLFRQRGEVTIRWMGRVGRLMQQQHLDASPAHVVEAVRLAEALATLRLRTLPGLDELEEAARTVFCQGDEHLMALLRERLIVGDAIGRVPPEIPAVPLQRDLEQCIRSARLTRESETTETIRKTLDLRKDSNRAASQLLHRLHFLGIPWGRRRQGSPFRTGSFSEEWTLKWKPDFAIRIIEASALGSTVREASANALMKRAAEGVADLAALATLAGDALLADLPEAIDPLILRMRELAALTHDLFHLLAALPPMVDIVAYGDTRQTDTEAVGQFVDEIIPRICIGLPGAALGIDDEPARALFQHVLATHHAIGLLHHDDHGNTWRQALSLLLPRQGIHELIRGAAARLLFDYGDLPVGEAQNQLYYALSPGQTPLAAAAWLEGFLHGGGMLLLHHPALWAIIDEWVDQLPADAFRDILPLLRRIFSRYTPAERRHMLSLAVHGRQDGPHGQADAFHEQRTRKLLPVLLQLLGHAE